MYANWASQNESDLRDFAALFRHDNDDGSDYYFAPEGASWHLVSIRPEALEAFDSVEAAREWITQEISMFKADGNGRAEAYEQMLANGFDEPVVLGTTLTMTGIWDGWHRTAIAMVRGTEMPAVIGIPHAVPWLDTAPPSIVPTVLVHSGMAGHDLLLHAMKALKGQRPDLGDAVDREFQGIAYFYDEAPGELGELAREAIRRAECTSAQDAIIASRGGDLAGLQLVNEQGQGALFLPDASEAGRVRASFFDQRGFFGHSTKDTYAELLAETFRDGYTREAPGTFEQYSTSSAFAEGNSLVAKLQAVNNGLMSLADALRTQRLSTAPANSMKL